MTLQRVLGRSGIVVSAMGMGCWAIGGPFWSGDEPHGWGEVDDDESISAIHCALDHGITFFDTANVYGAGHSERVLGKALAGRRSSVIIATKFTSLFDEQTRQVTGQSALPADIRKACEDSLRRLNTDVIDLYQFHDNGYPAEKAEPVRDTLEALTSEGKIRAYGWSTDFTDRADVFARGPRCATIQLQLNVLEDNPAMVALCERENLAAINRGPLAMGLLTGKYTSETKPGIDDVRGERSPAWMKYFKLGKPDPEWLTKVQAVREILTQDGRTLAQGAIGWLWARSENTIPIPGFRTVAQVEENSGALEKGTLPNDQYVEIEKIMGRGHE
jgi:aryl-alcohol dehydrogenase-like predicted oxidoreductase